MSTENLLSKFESSGFHFETDGGNLTVHPASRLDDRQRAFIRNHKPELLKLLTNRRSVAPEINATAQTIADEYDVSPADVLALLDASDIELILSGSEPSLIPFWRASVAVCLKRGEIRQRRDKSKHVRCCDCLYAQETGHNGVIGCGQDRQSPGAGGWWSKTPHRCDLFGSNGGSI
jgi:hypothetical protein